MNRTVTCILLFLILPVLTMQAQNGFEVPKSKVTRTIDGVDYYIHTVAKGQTVFKISKTYNITPEDLIRLNPEISDGIKPGQELRIPTGKKINKPSQVPATKPVVVDTVKTKPPVPVEKPCGMDPSAQKDQYEVALLMHLFLNEADDIDPDQMTMEDAESCRPFQFIQFYEGFMMAVDSLKLTGLPVTIHVYDVSTDTLKTKSFLQTAGLKKMDMIIGLLYHRNFQIVADFARKNNIPIVSPISERESQVNKNPEVIKIRPSGKTIVPQAADLIARVYPDANVVIVRNASSRFKESAEQLRKLCLEKNIQVSVCDPKTMDDQLKKDVQNMVVIFSENKSTILDLLTQLDGIKNQYQISVFGLPAWNRIDGLEVDYLVNLKTHMIASYYIDYDDDNVKKFVRDFQEAIKTDPDPLAFIGFDIGNFFLTALKRYGTSFPKCMNELDINMLESKYQFLKSETGGYENQQWMLYYYENFRVYDALKN